VKAWILIIGLVLLFFGLYKKFDLMTTAFGLIISLIGIFIKNKEKEKHE
jgi:hypothetical protein